MAHFYPLSVTDIRRETRDSVVVTLEPRAEDRADFNFIQGQYLTFRRKFDGEELRRSYSICSTPADEELRVGIKQVEGGAFSTFAQTLGVGDRIEVMAPEGRLVAEAGKVRRPLLIAAGSGITPVLSIARALLEADHGSEVTLLYGNRSAAQIMFRETLEALKDRFARLELDPEYLALMRDMGQAIADGERMLQSSATPAGTPTPASSPIRRCSS